MKLLFLALLAFAEGAKQAQHKFPLVSATYRTKGLLDEQSVTVEVFCKASVEICKQLQELQDATALADYASNLTEALTGANITLEGEITAVKITNSPSASPTTVSPTSITFSPTSNSPSTVSPSSVPTVAPTLEPTRYPTLMPTPYPTLGPTMMGETTTHVCENMFADLICDTGVIRIASAKWGRERDEMVQGLFDGVDTTSVTDLSCNPTRDYCPMKDVTVQVQDRCNGNVECNPKADLEWLEEPEFDGVKSCQDIEKYLQVIYDCVVPDATETHTLYACDDKYLELRCDHDELIEIESMEYGRWDQTKCVVGGLARPDVGSLCNVDQVTSQESEYEAGILAGLQTSTSAALDYVTSRCVDENNCDIIVKYNVFSNACDHFTPYAKVEYKCIQDSL